MTDKEKIDNFILEDSPEWCRETGKLFFFDKEADVEKKRQGMKLLIKAFRMRDTEATYLVGLLMVKGVIATEKGDCVKTGLGLISDAAWKGWDRPEVFWMSTVIPDIGKRKRYICPLKGMRDR